MVQGVEQRFHPTTERFRCDLRMVPHKSRYTNHMPLSSVIFHGDMEKTVVWCFPGPFPFRLEKPKTLNPKT